jgi:site-specific DNA recombinase
MKPSSSQAMNLTSDMKYAAIYARVSTEDQGKGFSIPTQNEACQQLATREGYTVPESHVLLDEGISGTTMDRPNLRKLRGLVNTQAIMAAIVYDPDLLFRNLGHQLLLAEEFERANVKLLMVSHPLEQGPEGWLFFQMRGHWRSMRRQSSWSAASGALEDGCRQGTMVEAMSSWGIGTSPSRMAGVGRLTLRQAPLVQHIFTLCLAGETTRGIARIPDDRERTNGVRQTSRARPPEIIALWCVGA